MIKLIIIGLIVLATIALGIWSLVLIVETGMLNEWQADLEARENKLIESIQSKKDETTN